MTKKIMSHTLLEGEGTVWDDIVRYYQLCEQRNKVCYPTRVQMWTGAFIDKIQLSYGEDQFPAHGINEPGGKTDFMLDENEFIVKIELCYMPWGNSKFQIRDLIFYTSKGETYSFHSWSNEKTGAKNIEYTLPEGSRLIAIKGKTDPFLHCVSGLTIYYECMDEGWEYSRDKFSGAEDFIAENIPNANHPGDNAIFIDKISIKKDLQSVSTSISTEINEVTMPNEVFSSLYDSQGISLLNVEDGKIRFANGSFYQLVINSPGREQDYYVVISASANAHVSYEKQLISKNIAEETFVLMEEKSKGSQLPYFKRPEIRMAMVDVEPSLQYTTKKKPLALYYWLVYLKAYMSAYPYVAVAIGVAALIYLIYKCFSSGNEENVEDKIFEELGKKIEWGAPQKNGAYYETISDFKPSLEAMDLRYYEGTDDKLKNWYKQLLEYNGNNLNANGKNKITRKDFLTSAMEKFRIDVGGEGFFVFNNICSGMPDALNINGKTHNSQDRNYFIPALIHINDWEKNSFPIEDNAVDTILMYGCDKPTHNEADEMIRCLSKKKGARIDTSCNDEAIIQYIVLGLEKKGIKVIKKRNDINDLKKEYSFYKYNYDNDVRKEKSMLDITSIIVS